MKLRPRHWLDHAARSLMLLAMVGLWLQSTAALRAQAEAAVGFMPGPARVIGAMLHSHGPGGKVMHAHVHATAGHVHNHTDPRDVDRNDGGLVWGFSGVMGVLPTVAYAPVAWALAEPLLRGGETILRGFKPDGLSRPPSTPGIA